MRKNIILSSTVLAMTLGVTASIVYAAEVPQSTAIHSSIFSVNQADLAAYNQVFKISTEAIHSIKNNGSQYASDRTIDKAIDGNINTFWETGKPNNATFKNAFEVTFKEAQTINRMTYATRQDGAKGKGFPKGYEIYVSQSDQGDDYKLVGTGTYATVNSNTMEFKFNEITAKRIKFVFTDTYQDWASASEIGFYKQDLLTEQIDAVFTDKTNTKLTTTYDSEGKITELEQLLLNHPMKEKYEYMIETARKLLDNPALSTDYVNQIRTLEQLGDPNHDAWSVKQQVFQLSNLQPTGLYYEPGEKFIIDVDMAEGDPKPVLVFDQNWDIKNGRQAAYTLKSGLNIITAPANVYPGGIYFINAVSPNHQKYAPRISIKSGGKAYPIYYSGKTNLNEYKQQLVAYKQKIDQLNVNGNIIVPNLATTVTDHALITGKVTDAYKAFITDRREPQAAADAWEDMLLYDYKILGYTKDAVEAKHRTPINRMNVRAVTDGMYAGGGLIGIGYNAESVLFGTDLGWGSFHEAGHVVEMGPLRFLELTNNLFSLANQERVGEAIRIETEDYFNAIFNKYTSGKVLGFNHQKRPDAEVGYGQWDAHLVLWQLRIAFGTDFYTDVFTLGRDKNFNAGNTAGDRWARLGSDVTDYDLGAYLHRMGMNLTEETLNYTSKYKTLDLAIQYADTNARIYKGTGFAGGYVSKIASVDKTGKDVKITIDAQNASADLMGFEVYRDGQLIGYTNKSTFIDKTVGEASNIAYQIKAFDRKLKEARVSEVVGINMHAPMITADLPVVTLKENQAFNPLDYVKAVTYDGQDLTSQIKVLTNTVNLAKPDNYSVTYEVTDTSGNNQKFELPVQVVSDFTYASDLAWKGITNSYSKTQKDKTVAGKAITLTNGFHPVVYKKGLGTHAVSTITYDVKDKGYQVFESIIGVEQNVADNNQSSVMFEVYVDGVKKYDSGVMYYKTAQKRIQVDIAGASEVKLILNDGGNGIGSDHGAWADAKFVILDNRTQESKDLQAVLDFVEPITDVSYVNPTIKTHHQARVNNLIAYKVEIEKLLGSKETTQVEMKNAALMMIYLIGELGQTYQAGGQPIVYK